MTLEWFWKLTGLEVGDEGMEITNGGPIDRTVADVILIFEEVTGIMLDRASEQFVIKHWEKQGWGNHDFRLIIEYHFGNAEERKFLDKPGNMNLRMMLNPARAERLKDILRDLKWRASDMEKQKTQATQILKLRPQMMMKCGMKIPVGDQEAYQRHMTDCFESKGKCHHAR